MIKKMNPYCAKVLGDLSLDVLVFFDLKNIRYCTGFTGSDGVYALSQTKDWFLCDSRYREQARLQVAASELICYQSKFDSVVELLRSSGFSRVGFEADRVSISQLQEVTQRSSGQLTWVPVTDEIRSLRGVKTSSEIALLQRAADLNAEAFSQIVGLIKPGVSEEKIALELEFALRRLGGEDRAFDFIVASGSRGALPHGVASERPIESGELVTIDFGTRVAGYHSDETVTIGVGEVPNDLRQIFDVVLEAHDLAITHARPGVVLADLDAIARQYIEKAGYGDYFGHGLGHGVGLDIHEYPTVSGRCKDKLEQGMVITIEPGIYLPDRGGVRIEDTIVITTNGCRTLTSIPKKYRALN
ncbi:MAG: aminopeptidase P family protein [Geopsychrobacter sp.]|nr:aminopeptidase P family protein [Geopsychrobacter sp.]